MVGNLIMKKLLNTEKIVCCIVRTAVNGDKFAEGSNFFQQYNLEWFFLLYVKFMTGFFYSYEHVFVGLDTLGLSGSVNICWLHHDFTSLAPLFTAYREIGLPTA